MHRAFIGGGDYEAYESPERARQRRENDREVHLATHAVYEAQRPKIVGDDATQAINARYGVPDTYASNVPERFRKVAPPVMDASELAEGPNLPHRDDKGISTLARDTSAKAGYYHAAVDAYSSDAYMDKRNPIEQKGNARHTYHRGDGEAYALPHGAGSKYRRTVDKKTGVVTDPHAQNGWGRALTATNKHLAYWRDTTANEALRNVDGRPRETREDTRWEVTLPRDMLVMLATVHDVQAQRGKLTGDNRGDMLRELAATVPPGEDVTLEWFTPGEVLAMTQGLPKRYKKGEFGQFLRDTATHVKLHK